MASQIYQNEKVVITVTVDESISGATALTWVLAQRNKPKTRLITKTLGDGVALTGATTFTVTLDPADVDAIKPGTYQQQARVLDALSVPNVLYFDDPLIDIKPTFTD